MCLVSLLHQRAPVSVLFCCLWTFSAAAVLLCRSRTPWRGRLLLSFSVFIVLILTTGLHGSSLLFDQSLGDCVRVAPTAAKQGAQATTVVEHGQHLHTSTHLSVARKRGRLCPFLETRVGQLFSLYFAGSCWVLDLNEQAGQVVQEANPPSEDQRLTKNSAWWTEKVFRKPVNWSN